MPVRGALAYRLKKAGWFGFFGAAGARSAFRGEDPPLQANGDPLQLRNPDIGALNRVAGGPYGHQYVPDETRAAALEIKDQLRSVTGPGRRHSDDPDDPSAHLDFVGTFKHRTEVYLGELATDAAGRLIVLGGRASRGRSMSTASLSSRPRTSGSCTTPTTTIGTTTSATARSQRPCGSRRRMRRPAAPDHRPS